MSLSFNNSEDFKSKAVQQAKSHAELDMLVKGSYGHVKSKFTGCSVGCFAFDILTEQGKDDELFKQLAYARYAPVKELGEKHEPSK